MIKKRNVVTEDKSDILIYLAISIRNSGYLLITSGILNIIISFLSIINEIDSLNLEEIIVMLAREISDLEFIIFLDNYVIPFFCIFLGFYALESYHKLLQILDNLADHLPFAFSFFKYLTRFFQTIFICVAVYICLLLLKLLI